MKLYLLRSEAIDNDSVSVDSVCDTTPGFTIAELLDMFYAEGVTPQFTPADLGTDDSTEVGADGWFSVDPLGDIRSSRLELMRASKAASAAEDGPVVTSGFDEDLPVDQRSEEIVQEE